MMRYIHYSAGLCLGVSSADQYTRMTDHGAKPDGLWFCAGENDGWEAFVKRKIGEGDAAFSVEQIRHQTDVRFCATAKVLFVNGVEEFDGFTENYSQISKETCERTRGLFRRPPLIDWPRLAQEFDAIVISPFRLDRLQYPKAKWYRCWDVASGCVWKPEAVVLATLKC
jgi:hypothetical protein